MTDEQLRSRAMAEPPVYWKNSRCIRVTEVGDKISFMVWHGGYTYTTTRVQWESGKLTEVH